jgi:glycerol kinase
MVAKIREPQIRSHFAEAVMFLPSFCGIIAPLWALQATMSLVLCCTISWDSLSGETARLKAAAHTE